MAVMQRVVQLERSAGKAEHLRCVGQASLRKNASLHALKHALHTDGWLKELSCSDKLHSMKSVSEYSAYLATAQNPTCILLHLLPIRSSLRLFPFLFSIERKKPSADRQKTKTTALVYASLRLPPDTASHSLRSLPSGRLSAALAGGSQRVQLVVNRVQLERSEKPKRRSLVHPSAQKQQQCIE
jgi:hypothetical protein